MAFLELVSGRRGQQIFDLGRGDIIIGRRRDCEVRLKSGTVSQRHAVIRERNGAYVLQDLRSRNGTRHNGRKLTANDSVELRAGDLLQISEFVFRFHSGVLSDRKRSDGPKNENDTRLLRSATTLEQKPPDNDKTGTLIRELDADSDSSRERAGEDAEAKLLALLQLGNRIGKLARLETLLPQILDGLFDIFPKATFGFVLLKQHERTRLVARSTNDGREFSSELFFDDQIAEQVLQTGKAILLNNESEDADEQNNIPCWSSLMCAPLMSETSDKLGVIQLIIAGSIEAFLPGELDVLATVGSLTSLAIENSNLHEQVLQQERLRALGQMASGAAHDLNNALSPVLGYADLILHQPDLPDHVRDWLAWIRTGASDAAAIVEQLQYFYQPKHLGEQSERVDLRKLMERIPRLTQPRWSDEVLRSGHTIELDLDLTAAPTVTGVESELRQVLTNLVFNAVDAMPDGGRIIMRLDATDNDAIIEVTDTGCGMTEEQQHRCFEPFFTTKDLGSGLGLSVCLGVVKRHTGRIELRSVPQEGTTVRIILPRCDQPAPEPRDTITSTSLPSYHVLYIDDDPRLRAVVPSLLEELGQRVDVAEDGVAGLTRLAADNYDFVITDLGMSGIDGREVILKVRQYSPQTPVLMLTGWSSMDVLNGADHSDSPAHFISKPPTLEKLHSALRAVVVPGDSPAITAAKAASNLDSN